MTANRTDFRNPFVAVFAAAVLATSGCGGGESSMPDDEADMMPDDDMMMDEVEPLPIPDGLVRSTAAPVTATSADDTLAELLPNPASMFAPLVAMFSGDSSEQSPRSELNTDIRVRAVSSDGANGFRVTFEDGGEEHVIHFAETDFVEGGWYAQNMDGTGYWLSSWTDSFLGTDKNSGSSTFTYFDVNQFGRYNETTNTTDRNMIVYGARTDAANLPSGSASYIGRMTANTFRSDTSSTDHRERLRGAVRLTADFDESTLDGMVFGISVQRAGEYDYSRLSDTTYFVIDGGRIVDGQFTATLAGTDSNDSAAMGETVRGYEGNVLGEFYGPAAEEVGAVLNASRSDRVMYGWLGGWQPDPNPPSGLHRSPADPLFATPGGGNSEDLLDAGEAFAPLTATLERTRDGIRAERSGDSYIRSISYDEQTDAFQVIYVVGGEEQMIQFLPEDERDWGYQNAAGDWFLLEDSEYGIRGESGLEEGTLRMHWTAGARTADLPSGTANYAGWMHANTWSQVDRSNTFRNDVSGNVSLTADFDASTLQGRITNLRNRWQLPEPREWVDLPDTTRFEISDGQIADGQFTATLTGVDTNENAALGESMRGYEGDVLGEFYGPNAEEVGGVINATRDEDLRVMSGRFIGDQQ